MYLIRSKRGQSTLEYALLIGIVAAGILIMQAYVKRGFQGGMKGASDDMGEQYSVQQSTIYQGRSMEDSQIITDETLTDGAGSAIGGYVTGISGTANDLLAKDVLSLNKRSGGTTTSTMLQSTDSATTETYKWEDYEDEALPDFSEPW